MFLVSSPELVIESCRAGIIGAFPTPNARSIGELDRWLTRIGDGVEDARRDARPGDVVGPWATNVVTHRTNARLPEDLALIARHRPPIVITALGSPKPAIPIVRDYGGLVLADVTTLALARKAIDAGVDGLVCVCAGAGGHTGHLSPFAFISAVREIFDGIVIAGGGIADGWGVAGAIAAGADIAYVGTRFIAAEESSAHPEHKRLVMSEIIDGLVTSDAITGTPASWIKESLRAAGLDPDALASGQTSRDYDSSAGEKKRWKEIFAAGQGIGRTRTLQKVRTIADELALEYRAAAGRLAALSVLHDPAAPDAGAISP